MGREASLSIGQKAASSVYYAVGSQAERIGLPLNHLVTYNFSAAGFDPREAVPAFGRLRLNYFNKWAARPPAGLLPTTAAYAYSFENYRDDDDHAFETMEEGDPHNVHVHWLVHVPGARAHDFEGRAHEWLEAVIGPFTAANAVDVRAITYGDSPVILRNYLLKGGSARAARFCGKTRSAQGIIIGRRAGTSRSLGPTARRAMDSALGVRRRLPSRPHPYTAQPPDQGPA